MLKQFARTHFLFCAFLFFSFRVATPTPAELFVSSHDTSQVLRYNSTNGAFIDIFIPNQDGRLQQPHGLAFGPDRQLYVASAGNDRVLRYNSDTGAFIDEFIPSGSGGLDYPVALIFRGGYLYVSGQLNNSVIRYNARTGAYIDTFVTPGLELSGPSDMQFYSNGNLWVVGRFSNNINVYNGTNGAFIETFATNGLSQPFGLRFDGANLLVASGNDNAVKRIDLLSGLNLGSIVSAGAGDLALPIGIVFGPDRLLYVASYNNHKIAKFDPFFRSYLGDFVTSGSGGLRGPNFMVFHPISPALSIAQINSTTFQISWTQGYGESGYRLYESDTPDFINEQPVEGIPINSGGISTLSVGGKPKAFYRMRSP
jgi:WD40 repeat protein